MYYQFVHCPFFVLLSQTLSSDMLYTSICFLFVFFGLTGLGVDPTRPPRDVRLDYVHHSSHAFSRNVTYLQVVSLLWWNLLLSKSPILDSDLPCVSIGPLPSSTFVEDLTAAVAQRHCTYINRCHHSSDLSTTRRVSSSNFRWM
jgi:hypothetical protein